MRDVDLRAKEMTTVSEYVEIRQGEILLNARTAQPRRAISRHSGIGRRCVTGVREELKMGMTKIIRENTYLGNYISNALMQVSGTDGASGADIGSVA